MDPRSREWPAQWGAQLDAAGEAAFLTDTIAISKTAACQTTQANSYGRD